MGAGVRQVHQGSGMGMGPGTGARGQAGGTYGGLPGRQHPGLTGHGWVRPEVERSVPTCGGSIGEGGRRY